MLQSLGWAALGTGFTFLMTALGAAMVFFFAGEPRPHFQKTLLGFAAGVMTAASVWSLLLPAIDRAKETVAYKLISAVPGVGTAMNTAVGAVIGSGVLIRNVLGMGSLLIILLICAVPVVRVCMVLLSYKIVQAVIQPVTEKRLLEGMDAMTQGVGMLLHVLVSCVLMFILSLAVVCNAAAVVAV